MRRHQARRDALELLYQADLSGEETLRVGAGELDPYTVEISKGVGERIEWLDSMIEAAAENWNLDRMPAVDRNILRMGAWEVAETSLPVAVVIDEAVELAKEYSTEDSGRFVNGVLSAIASKLRGPRGDDASGEMAPAYGIASLAEVTPWCMAALGLGDFPAYEIPAPPSGIRHVVVLVIDGLGNRQIREFGDSCPTIAETLSDGVVTSTFPSTTGAGLTTITTGCPPGAHGIVGYRFRVGDEMLNAIRFTVGDRDARENIDPVELQPEETIFERMAALGFSAVAVTRREFEGSGFSSMFLRGASWAGWEKPEEIGELVAANRRRAEISFTYAYFDAVDHMGHEFGVGSDEYIAALAMADAICQDIVGSADSETALLLTADHGMVDVAESDRVYLVDELAGLCSSIGGEGRCRFLYAHPGKEEALFEATDTLFSEWAMVVSASEAIEAGWFGPVVTPDSRARIGDVMVASRSAKALFHAAGEGFIPRGNHGSLTPEEMEVPFRTYVG